MNSRLALVMVGLLATACTKKEQPAATPNVAPPPGVSGAKSETTVIVTTPPPADEKAEPMDAKLSRLNDSLSAYVERKGMVPTDPNALVQAGFLSRLPAPPPGKKWAIDPKKIEFVLADQ